MTEEDQSCEGSLYDPEAQCVVNEDCDLPSSSTEIIDQRGMTGP